MTDISMLQEMVMQKVSSAYLLIGSSCSVVAAAGEKS